MKTEQGVKRLVLIILGILFFQTAFSQENYLSGKIITLTNDTVSGFINYRNWAQNPNKISFKEHLDDEKRVYSTNDIKGFIVADEIYISATVETEYSGIKTEDLNFESDLKIRIEPVFLQAMILGEKSLYYFKDKEDIENFYIKMDSAYILLIYKEYLKKQDGKTVAGVNNKYLGQLKYYLRDCPDIQSKINGLQYKQKSLVKLFQNYYACHQSEAIFQNKSEKISSEMGGLVGASLTSLSFQGDLLGALRSNYEPSLGFSAGLFYTILLPRNLGKWSINNELLLYSFKSKGSYNNTSSYSNYYTEIGYASIKLNNMLRYKRPFGNLQVFVNLGISNSIGFNETNYKLRVIYYAGIERIQEGEALSYIRKYERALNFGIGAEYKKYSFEIRFERGDGVSDYVDLQSTTNKLFFLFGYRF